MAGYTGRFLTASDLLSDLPARPYARSRHRRVRHYSRPDVLGLNEVCCPSYDNRYADLIYDVISARYQHKSTILTTNRPFSLWPKVFPNAVTVVTLVDQISHHAEIVKFVADSYRLKEAAETAKVNALARRLRASKSRV